MQGSVHTFDPESDAGSVLLDTGRELAFDADVFAASSLRHLRTGQRLSLEVTGDPEQEGVVVSRLWIVGIGAGEAIR
jgi:cold shock CspA family protein